MCYSQHKKPHNLDKCNTIRYHKPTIHQSTTGEHHIYEIIVLCFGTWLTGVSKAGFGGGIGMIVVPLFTQFRPARNVVALMLPLLFSTDVISLGHYWKQWDKKSIWRLIPGAIIGIALASLILNDLSNEHLKKIIGGIACLFAVLEFLRGNITNRLNPNDTDETPAIEFKAWHGVLIGAIGGVFSTLAHMAGPIIIIYLLPQRLGNRTFVATTTLLYFFINMAKIPAYFHLGMFSWDIIIEAIVLLPFVGLGVQVGVYLNSRFSERNFSRIVLIFLFATGIYILLFS